MFDTSSNGIRKIIEKGESQTIEFKSTFPANHIVACSLTAFANTDGGIILFGVDDYGTVIGLSDYRIEYTTDRLKRISDSLLPDPIQIGEVIIDSKKIVYAIIEKTPDAHFPIMTSRGEIYKRQSSSVVLTRNEQRRTSSLTEKIASVAPKRDFIAFVAMSLRDEEEPALIDYFTAMKRAIASVGLPIRIKRLDLVEGDYEISQRIMTEIDKSDIVIADFTLNSPNVYFELGYARAKNCRIIQTARKGTVLEFDIRNWRTLFYRNATELEEKLASELISAYTDLAKTSK